MSGTRDRFGAGLGDGIKPRPRLLFLREMNNLVSAIGGISDEMPTWDEKIQGGRYKVVSIQGLPRLVYWHARSGAVDLTGPFYSKWFELRETFGYPLQREQRIRYASFGKYDHYVDFSNVYRMFRRSGDENVYEMHGAILAKWRELCGEKRQLGSPTTDETVSVDGVGRFNDFDSGSIYWYPATGAHLLRGASLARWLELGGGVSYLGCPVSDTENDTTEFQGGRLSVLDDQIAEHLVEKRSLPLEHS